MPAEELVSHEEPHRRKVAINPANVPAPIRGYYSTCVRVSAGPLLFVSGQLGTDVTGRFIGNRDVAAQADQALRNIENALAIHGSKMSDVVKVTVYVTDIASLDKIAPVRMKYFPAEGPASAIVQVSALAFPEALVEIDAIAAVP
jgi:2-iminobutanoate/2-iminopropanoate deaminase